jgi:hypothetical protein
LALNLETARLSLAVVCADGSLLVVDGDASAETAVRYETPDDPAWREVLASGNPLVVRQSPSEDQDAQLLTAFYLPLGRDPVLAVVTIVVGTAAEAHHIHEVSGEIIYLLQKRLLQLLRKENQRDRLERLAALAEDLAQIAALRQITSAELAERIGQSARRLTGAQNVLLVGSVTEGIAQPLNPHADADQNWLREAGRLLSEAQADGWRVTLCSGSAQLRERERCLLVVTSLENAAAPGLVLWDKERLHKLDGTVFTAFDAELARHLARLIPVCIGTAQAEADRRGGGRGAEQQAEIPAVEGGTLPTAQAAEPGPERPATPSGGPATEAQHAPSGLPAARANGDIILEILRKEMDRCDRYHCAFALIAARPRQLAAGESQPWDSLIQALQARVRSSDTLTCLADGTLLLLAPEDIQSVTRLQRRLVGLLQQLSGQPDLQVATSHALYPGHHDDPQQMLQDTLASLTERS